MDLTACTVLMFIIGNKGLACEALSPPQCFRSDGRANLYTCEWRVPASMTNATFYLHFRNADGEKWGKTIKETKYSKDSMQVARGEAVFIRRRFVVAECLITNRSVYIWVTAHMGNSSCVSANTSVILSHTVKYAEPQNVRKSWSANDLRLSWNGTEKKRAAVQLLFRRHSDTTGPWENRSMETNATDMYQVTVLNLQRDSAYQVQIRYKSIDPKALNALWSDWSEVQVPIVIENPPKVTLQEIDKGTHRVLRLTWKAPSLEASVGGVNYTVSDSQSCRCRKDNAPHNTTRTAYTMHVSNSPVNISIIAKNQVGQSSPAVLNVRVKLTKDIKPCDHPPWVRKKNRSSCVELYTFQHGDPIRVKTLPARKKYDKMNLLAELEDYVRYYSFEHECKGRTLNTIKMCLGYKTEGAPRVKPPGLAYNKTHNLSKLWWKAIPVEDQRGFLTNYTVCISKTSTQDLHPNEECHNVSASHTEHPIDNLSPGFMYNISVVGVTTAGAGPKSILIIKSAEESKSWKNAWSALVVVFVFLFISILCTFIFKRFKKRILPPVPVPVLHPTDTYCPEEMLEMKEEVHELTLHRQPSVPDITAQTPEDQTETTAAPSAEEVTDDDDSEEDSEHLGVMGGSDTSEGPCDEPIICSGYKGQGLKPCVDVEVSDALGPGDGDSEVVPLVYRNGLVFDMKAE